MAFIHFYNIKCSNKILRNVGVLIKNNIRVYVYVRILRSKYDLIKSKKKENYNRSPSRCLFITSIQLRSVFFIRYCTIVQSAASRSYSSLIIRDTSTRLRYDVQLCVRKFINIEWSFLNIITRVQPFRATISKNFSFVDRPFAFLSSRFSQIQQKSVSH